MIGHPTRSGSIATVIIACTKLNQSLWWYVPAWTAPAAETQISHSAEHELYAERPAWCLHWRSVWDWVSVIPPSHSLFENHCSRWQTPVNRRADCCVSRQWRSEDARGGIAQWVDRASDWKIRLRRKTGYGFESPVRRQGTLFSAPPPPPPPPPFFFKLLFFFFFSFLLSQLSVQSHFAVPVQTPHAMTCTMINIVWAQDKNPKHCRAVLPLFGHTKTAHTDRNGVAALLFGLLCPGIGNSLIRNLRKGQWNTFKDFYIYINKKKKKKKKKKEGSLSFGHSSREHGLGSPYNYLCHRLLIQRLSFPFQWLSWASTLTDSVTDSAAGVAISLCNLTLSVCTVRRTIDSLVG